MKYINLDENDLTSLDVSGLKALEKLGCGSNDLPANALNRIFKDLPQRKNNETGDISIYGNPGSDGCDESIAEKKGWDVQRW